MKDIFLINIFLVWNVEREFGGLGKVEQEKVVHDISQLFIEFCHQNSKLCQNIKYNKFTNELLRIVDIFFPFCIQ